MTDFLTKMMLFAGTCVPFIITGLTAAVLVLHSVKEGKYVLAFIDFCAVVFAVQVLVVIVKVVAGK